MSQSQFVFDPYRYQSLFISLSVVYHVSFLSLINLPFVSSCPFKWVIVYNRTANPKSYRSNLSDLLSASLWPLSSVSISCTLATCIAIGIGCRRKYCLMRAGKVQNTCTCIILQIKIFQWLAILVCVFCSVCVVSQKPNSHTQSTCIHYMVVNTVIHKLPLFTYFRHM